MRYGARLCFLSFIISFFTAFAHGQGASQGQWSALENWPTRAVHASVLPDGRVFFVSYYDESQQPNIWDPVADTFSPTTSVPYLIFCAGHTGMADGRIFIAGGHIADFTGFPHAGIYDPFNDTFTQVPDMNEGRWYPTTTVLGNGDILVTSGDVNGNGDVNPVPEVFQVASSTWRDLTTAQLMQALYPVTFVAPNGNVIYAGPEPLSRYLDTSGTGTWTDLATQQFANGRDYGPGVMYEVGQILEVGGSDPPTATAEIIDLMAATPAWSFTGSMNFPRRQHNAVILPDGKVFIVGGSSGGGFDDDTNPVFPTEMWDPATGQFTVMASIAVYRGYHSTALLLPDGRVLSGGGNVGGANAQIYSPPYLFAGARPSVSSAPSSVGYGDTIFIGTPDAADITQVTWLRNSSTTHTFDEGGRFMHLNFTQTLGGLNVTMPDNGNIAPPGYYMLFILNSSGVPSVASIIQITQGGGGTGTLTGTVTNTSGAPLANASVTTGSRSAQTAADGTYTITNAPVGAATVTASLGGYNSASTQVTVTAGSNTVPTLKLGPINPGAITGSVVGSGGNAFSGARVTGAGLTATTDTNGNYTLSNVPAGSVTLTASATGFQPATESVTVTAGKTTTAPAMTLISNQGNVTGKVTGLSNNAISGASVSFGGGFATTDANGIYNFTNIPVGTIQLVASAQGFQSVTQNVTVMGGTTTTANFSLPGTATASVTISGSLLSTPATAGSNAGMTSFVTPDGNPHVFYVSNNQHVYQLSWTSAAGWQGQDMTALTAGPSVGSGSGLGSLVNQAGLPHVYYVDGNQHISDTFQGAGGNWGTEDITRDGGGPLAAAGSPIVALGASNDAIAQVFYFDSNRHVNRLYWPRTGGFTNQDMTALTSGSLAGSGSGMSGYVALYGGPSVHFIGADQHVHTIDQGGGGDWGDGDMTSWAGTTVTPVVGSPLRSLLASNDSFASIFYVDTNHHIDRLYWPKTGGFTNQDMTALTAGSLIGFGSGLSGDVASYGGASVFFIGPNQHVNQIDQGGGGDWGDGDLTSFVGGAPLAAAGSPVSVLLASGDAKGHIFYVDTNRHINRLYWPASGGFQNQDLNANMVVDSGTVSLNIGNFTATACYGASTNAACSGQPANNTPSQVAAALAQAINVASSPAVATVNGSTINLTAKAGGNVTTGISALATTHDQPSAFASPSFTSPATSFSGGGP